ncbi:MAG: hypothetical protein JRJ87_08175 [Deltaproteobacteria bacterium]|nr:hypothetical protein [Deltaproteobacteria bacterium]
MRELRNAIERAIVIAQGTTISIEDLPEKIRNLEDDTPAAQSPDDPAGDQAAQDDQLNLKSEMNRLEAELILGALRENDWDRKKAARALGLPVRTLAHKMQTHNIKKIAYQKK